MLFLLTNDTGDKKFVETLIDPHKIVTIRLFEIDSEFRMIIEDCNNNSYVARYSTEYALREKLKQLLIILNTPITVADTIKIAKPPELDRKGLSEKLEALIKKL